MRWGYEQRRVLRDERRHTYAEFLVNLSALEHDTVGLARAVASRGKALAPEGLRHPEALDDDVLRVLVSERNAVAERMVVSYETLKLVATAALRERAEAVIDSYNGLLALARQGVFEPDPTWATARRSLRERQRDLRDEAREELLGSAVGRA
jgi:hypothetical protein